MHKYQWRRSAHQKSYLMIIVDHLQVDYDLIPSWRLQLIIFRGPWSKPVWMAATWLMRMFPEKLPGNMMQCLFESIPPLYTVECHGMSISRNFKTAMQKWLILFIEIFSGILKMINRWPALWLLKSLTQCLADHGESLGSGGFLAEGSGIFAYSESIKSIRIWQINPNIHNHSPYLGAQSRSQMGSQP